MLQKEKLIVHIFLYVIQHGMIHTKDVNEMPKTIKPGQMADPQMRVGFSKRGGMRWLRVSKGNPDAIRGQQQKLASCAKSAAGLRGAAFRAKVKSCAKK